MRSSIKSSIACNTDRIKRNASTVAWKATRNSSSTTMWRMVNIAMISLTFFPSLVVSAVSRWSEDEETISQYILNRFAVRLTNTPTPVDAGQADIYLREPLESTLFAHIAKASQNNLEYVWLLDVESTTYDIVTDDPTRRRGMLGTSHRQLVDEETGETTVFFYGATISFKDPVARSNIDGWIVDAVEMDLPDELAYGEKSSPFLQVTEAEYISFDLVPTAAPVGIEIMSEDNDRVVDGAEESNFDVLPPDDKNGVIKGVGAASGLLLVLVGLALLAKKQRDEHAADQVMRDLELEQEQEYGQKSAQEVRTVIEDDIMTDTLENDGANSEMAAYSTASNNGLLDSVSVVSEYTEDASKVSSPTRVASSSVYAENFDRETRLQKDMLQGEWSLPLSNGAAVRIPSDLDSSESVPGGMSFEKAYDENQGEEIYLMPPSRSRGNRKSFEGDDGVC